MPEASAEEAVLRADEDRLVLGGLAALPRRQREALVLRYYQRLSEAEIAVAMGIEPRHHQIHHRPRAGRAGPPPATGGAVNTDEELLTGVLDRAAGRITAGALRPLAEPRTAPSRLNRARRAIRNTRLAPAAAAVAVVLVVAVALLVTSGTHRPGAGEPHVRDGRGGAAEVLRQGRGQPAQRAARPRVGRGRGPGHHHRGGGGPVRTPAIGTAPKPIPLSVAAGPDDRTFYALYASWGRVPDDFWIYRFRITPSGTASGLTAIRGGLITGQGEGNVGGFAVSPGGRGWPWPWGACMTAVPRARWPGRSWSSTCAPARTPPGEEAWSGPGRCSASRACLGRERPGAGLPGPVVPAGRFLRYLRRLRLLDAG